MTSGYSGTPLAKKLGIKEGMKITAVGPPDNYLELLAPLPNGVAISGRLQQETDILHLFTNSLGDLVQNLADARRMIKQNGMIWVSWYKKAAKLPTELTEDSVREAALQLDLVDVKVCAVDDKWSGLKLVIRKEFRL